MNLSVVKIEPQDGGAVQVSLKLHHDQALLDAGRLGLDDMVAMRRIVATAKGGQVIKGRILSAAGGPFHGYEYTVRFEFPAGSEPLDLVLHWATGYRPMCLAFRLMGIPLSGVTKR